MNIAIEYDENGHASYKYEEYEDRQKEIEKELGCKFIRVTDKESDECNIGLVIKEFYFNFNNKVVVRDTKLNRFLFNDIDWQDYEKYKNVNKKPIEEDFEEK